MMNKESKYINVKGQLMDLSEPRVMGIPVSYTHLTLPTN